MERMPARRRKTLIRLLAAPALVLCVLFLYQTLHVRPIAGGRPLRPIRPRPLHHHHQGKPIGAPTDTVNVPPPVSQAETTTPPSNPKPKPKPKPKPNHATKPETVLKPEELAELDKLGGMVAYLSIISNNKYVDGAMMLAYTLRKHSPLLQSGRAKCVLLIPSTIAEDGKERLRLAGWDEVREIVDLSPHAPRAHFKDTFNKLYMFDLTEYHLVAYYDVDVLPLHNPDGIFTQTQLPNETYVGAIGNLGDTYFKTGMVVVKPSKAMFEAVLRPLKEGRYNVPSGRDGALLREFFNGRFRPIPPIYSQYRRPWQDLKGCIVFHFRGEFKPWYNALDVPRNKWRDPERPPDQSPAYRIWWQEYHLMHFALFGGDPQSLAGTWGGKAAGPDVTPLTHLWLLRNTKEEYLKPVWQPSMATVPIEHGNRTVVNHRHFTCDTPCHENHKSCIKNTKDRDLCNGICKNFHDCVTSCEFRASKRTGEEGEATGWACQSMCAVGPDGHQKMIRCDDTWPAPAKPEKKDRRKARA